MEAIVVHPWLSDAAVQLPSRIEMRQLECRHIAVDGVKLQCVSARQSRSRVRQLLQQDLFEELWEEFTREMNRPHTERQAKQFGLLPAPAVLARCGFAAV